MLSRKGICGYFSLRSNNNKNKRFIFCSGLSSSLPAFCIGRGAKRKGDKEQRRVWFSRLWSNVYRASLADMGREEDQKGKEEGRERVDENNRPQRAEGSWRE